MLVVAVPCRSVPLERRIYQYFEHVLTGVSEGGIKDISLLELPLLLEPRAQASFFSSGGFERSTPYAHYKQWLRRGLPRVSESDQLSLGVRFVEGLLADNAYGRLLADHLSQVMKVMRFSKVQGNFGVDRQAFEALFGDLSYLQFPLYHASDYGHADFRARNLWHMGFGKDVVPDRYYREAGRLEMVPLCVRATGIGNRASRLQHRLEVQNHATCRHYLHHAPTNLGICTVYNGPRFDDTFLGRANDSCQYVHIQFRQLVICI